MVLLKCDEAETEFLKLKCAQHELKVRGQQLKAKMVQILRESHKTIFC